MGTSAVYGFLYNNFYKVAYTQFDGYPRIVGNNVLECLQKHKSVKELRKIFKMIKLVEGNEIPTINNIDKYRCYMDSYEGPSTWYWLLHKMQGNLELNIKEGIMVNGIKYLETSEWGFISDLDFKCLVVKHYSNIIMKFPLFKLKTFLED